MSRFIKPFFYSNIFYGVCTVTLCIESNLQHQISLNSYRFYLLIFLATVIYYGRIYYKSSAVVLDERTKWYRLHRPLIKKALFFLSAIMIADFIYIVYLNFDVLLKMPFYYWCLFLGVSMAGLMYTFRILPSKLRRFGRLKPFVIGFVWAGVVTIFPVLFWQIRNPNEVAPGISTKALLWLQNFLFISSLAIVFDIKDFKSDKRLKLQTYPAKYGIKKTIHFAIVPLALLCLMILVIQHIVFPYTVTESLLQSFPYFILILITGKLYAERNLLFYLAGIDGLMLLKAICGIISITLL